MAADTKKKYPAIVVEFGEQMKKRKDNPTFKDDQVNQTIGGKRMLEGGGKQKVAHSPFVSRLISADSLVEVRSGKAVEEPEEPKTNDPETKEPKKK